MSMTQAIDDFASGMALAVRQAGLVARGLRGRVANDGKEDDSALPGDDDLLRARRAAKTIVDEVIQEVLILAAMECLDSRATILDAEEATAMTARFCETDCDQTLVIDPIDGTLEYLSGIPSYSICVGLVKTHMMATALVLFPERDTLYLLTEGGAAFSASNVLRAGLRDIAPLAESSDRATRVYVNRRVPGAIQDQIRRRGYEVIDDTVDGRGAPDCILECLAGQARAYVAHTRQMRDILLGGIIAGAPGGFALDWSGAPLAWPSSGRVSRAIFGCGGRPTEILECLTD
jgi:fructose-1,6-bisphosphatase/inositol monophosphatase family enzyme